MSVSGGLEPWLVLFLVSGVAAAASSNEISEAPKLVDSIEKLNHPEGTNAILACSVGSGHLEGLTYEWLKDDQRLTSSTAKIKITIPQENDQSVLRVIDLTPKDAGVYSCIATNSYGSDRISIKLNVKVQLKWTTEPTDVRVHAGKPVHLPCRAEGNPEPRVTWRKLDSEEQRELGSELRFSAASPGDSGFYECRAENGVDKELTRRIRLEVLGK